MSDTTHEQSPDPGLLTDTYPDLHNSGEVAWAVRQSPEHIPNDPKDRVATYLGSLTGRHGMLGGSEERRQAQIEHHVMDPADIPEGYFEHQRQIAREQGHGDIEITQEMRDQLAEALIADQTASLQSWVEYINHPDADYPEWFRYYTLRNVLKLADYDKEKGRFRKRSRGTTAPYPELNREALAYVYDKLEDRQQGGQQDDPEVQQLVQSANFNKLYSHALRESMPANPEQLTDTAGEWSKYDQLGYGEDSDRARQLADSLQGHGTGWCSAGESTAEMQLKGGDFYIYYSYDENEEATVPRAAIRMENGQVAEVRGIDANQELEPAMLEIVQEQLEDLPGGAEYQQRAENMKRLTAIEQKIAEDPDAELSRDELRFLYEMDREIIGFGYEKDPRIEELQSQSSFTADMEKIYATPDHNVIAERLIEDGDAKMLADHLNEFEDLSARIAQQLIETGQGGIVAGNLDKFEGLDYSQTAHQLIEADQGSAVAANLDKFDSLDHTQIAQHLIETNQGSSVLARHFDKFHGLDHTRTAQQLIEAGGGSAVVANLDKFEDIDHDQIAQQLVEAGHGATVVNYLERFQGIDHERLARQLIQAGLNDEALLRLSFSKLEGFNSQTAQQLIKNGYGEIVAENLDRFASLDRNHIALQLVITQNREVITGNLDQFKGLDDRIISKINNWYDSSGFLEGKKKIELVQSLIDNSEMLDYDVTAPLLIEANMSHTIVENLDKFYGLDHDQIAQRLISTEKGYLVAETLYKFEELSYQTAQQLIDVGKSEKVASNIDAFQVVNHNQIARQLVESGAGGFVAVNIHRFQNTNHNQIAQRLVATGDSRVLTSNMNKFKGLDLQTARQLINSGPTEGMDVAKHITSFEGVEHSQIAQDLIENGFGFDVAKNLELFHGLDHGQVVQQLIEKGKGSSILFDIDKFKGVDRGWIAQQIIKAGQEDLNVVYTLHKFETKDHSLIARELIEAGKSDIVVAHIDRFENLSQDVLDQIGRLTNREA